MSDAGSKLEILVSRDLSWDEYRLIQYFRMIHPSERDAVLSAAGRAAADRWYFDFDPINHAPTSDFGRSGEINIPPGDYAHYDHGLLAGYEMMSQTEGWIFEKLTQGDVEEFTEVVNSTLVEIGNFGHMTESQAVRFLNDWKLAVMVAIRERFLAAAQTADEARHQAVHVPESVDGWCEFANTIDGDAISEELDLPVPGSRFIWPFRPTDGPDIVEVRLMLQHWFRRSQADDEHHRDPPDDTEIQCVLDWLRERLPQPKPASDDER